VLSWTTYLISIGNNVNSRTSSVAPLTILHALLPVTSKAKTLPMETEPVAVTTNWRPFYEPHIIEEIFVEYYTYMP